MTPTRKQCLGAALSKLALYALTAAAIVFFGWAFLVGLAKSATVEASRLESAATAYRQYVERMDTPFNTIAQTLK